MEGAHADLCSAIPSAPKNIKATKISKIQEET